MSSLDLPFFSRRAAGFSLTEMLVVVGIITVMSTIVISSFFRGRDTNRLTAAEHVLSGAIRQARHTARSSGMPVALRLESTVVNNERVGITMSGQFRVPIWTETFDGEGQVIVPDRSNGLDIGRSGNGQIPSQQNPIIFSFVRGQSFNRGSGSTRTDGFFMSCRVRPGIPAATGDYIPLMILGDGNNGDQYQTSSQNIFEEIYYSKAQAVLELRYNPPPNDPLVITPAPVWEIVGRVYESKDRYCTVSSKHNRILLQAAIENNLGNPQEAPFLVEPNRWIEIGLLYDGYRLYLYTNDEPIAVQHAGVPKKLASGTRCFVGQHTADNNPTTYAGIIFDDIRISKLGQNDAMAFPDGVIFANKVFGYRIMCHSNGRVEVFKDQDQNTHNEQERAENDLADSDPDNKKIDALRKRSDATISFEQRQAPGTIQRANITVGLDGRVSSQLITGPIPNSSAKP